MKIYVITRNTLEILLFDNTLKSYLTNLDEYKKSKYICNYFFYLKILV